MKKNENGSTDGPTFADKVLSPLVGKLVVAGSKRDRDDKELFRLLRMQEVQLPKLEVENLIYFKFKLLLKKFDAVWAKHVSPALEKAIMKGSGGADSGAWARAEKLVQEQVRNAVLSRWAFLNHHIEQTLAKEEKKKEQEAKEAAKK